MASGITVSIVEAAALEWFEGLGYTILLEIDIAPGACHLYDGWYAATQPLLTRPDHRSGD